MGRMMLRTQSFCVIKKIEKSDLFDAFDSFDYRSSFFSGNQESGLFSLKQHTVFQHVRSETWAKNDHDTKSPFSIQKSSFKGMYYVLDSSIMSAGSFRSARSICLLSQKRYNELPNCSWSVTTTRVGGFGSSRNSNHIGSRFCSSVSQRYVANCSSTYSHVIINNNRPFISNNCRYFNTAKATSNISRPDPFARRPNQKCDPYGQGGKPLSMADAQKLLSTVDKEWKLDIPSQEEDDEREGKTDDDEVEASLPTTQSCAVDETSGRSKDDGDDASYKRSEMMIIPKSISREFYHTEFIDGSKFASKIAALSQMNNHYPTITLHRKVLKKQKQWVSVTKITCHTNVLNGLSYNDFHLAMLIDVEIERPENKSLWIKNQ